jgi:hypothetical protein
VGTITPHSYNDLPLSVKVFLQGGSFKMGTIFGLKDYYPEPGLPLLEESSLDLNDPKHEAVADAMNQLQFNSYYRHFKTHALKRIPINCQDLNPGSFQTDPFFNSHYHFAGQPCMDLGFSPATGPEATPWAERIANDAHDLDLNFGHYHKAMSDFFYQMDYQTGDIGLGSNDVSMAVSRTFMVENPGTVIPVNGILANGSNEVDPLSAQGFNFAISNQPEIPEKAIYYLCVNNLAWRSTLQNRLTYMSRLEADQIVFDVNHMPKEGCYCSNCRAKYRNDGAMTLEDNWVFGSGTDPVDYFLGGGLFQDENDLWQYTNAARRLNADLMNTSLIDHFADLQPAMHEFGATAVVTTGEFPGMVTDAHRSAFVRSVDVPKGEWTMPLKSVNNRPFYGANDPQFNDFFRIPENVRLMGSIAMYRDASQHRLAHVWMPTLGYYRPTTATTFELSEKDIMHRNNQLLRTWIGAGVVSGVINVTTFGENFFELDGSSNIMFNKHYVCQFDPATPNLIGGGVCPNSNSGDVDIVRLAEEHYGLIEGKRPYMHYGVYFSETLRNDWLYQGNDNQYGGVVNDRFAFQRAIMPALLGYQSLTETPTFGWVNESTPLYESVTYKFIGRRIYPVGFVFDDAPILSTVKVLLAPEDCDLSHLQNQNGISIVSIPRHHQNDPDNLDEDYYRIGHEDDTDKQLKRIAEEAFTLENNPAPFYIQISDPKNYHYPKVHASFFTPTGYDTDPPTNYANYSALTVPLVIDPVWGLVRGSWDVLALDVVAGNNLKFEVIGKLKPINGSGVPIENYTYEFDIPLGTTFGSITLGPVTENINGIDYSLDYALDGYTISWTVTIVNGQMERYFSFEGQRYPTKIIGNQQGDLHYFIPYGDPGTANAYDYGSRQFNFKIELHIKAGSLPNDISYANVYDDNPDTPPTIIYPIQVNGEYVFTIPPFSRTSVIDVITDPH